MKNSLPKIAFFTLFALASCLSIISATTLNRSSKIVLANDGSLEIYNDSLASGWQNWSWGGSANFDSSPLVASGSKSISFNSTAWGGLYLHTDTEIDLTSFKSLNFSLYHSGPGEQFSLLLYDTNNQVIQPVVNLNDISSLGATNTWIKYSIPTSQISSKKIKGLAVQETAGIGGQVYLDEIKLVAPQAIPTANPVNQTISQVVFDNSLAAEWNNWSWGANVDFNSSNSYSGNTAMIFSPYSPWAGFYLHRNQSLDLHNFKTLRFAARADQDNQEFRIGLYGDSDQPLTNFLKLADLGGNPSGQWKIYEIPLSALNPQGQAVKGVAIQNGTGTIQPTLYLDEIGFIGENSSPLPLTSPTPSNLPAVSPTASPTNSPVQPPIGSGAYSTSSGKIYHNGQQVQLRGVNWFGAETETSAPHGLWARNYKEMIQQMKTLGFNAVRIPFCPSTLRGNTASGIDSALNSDLVGLNSLQVLDKVVGELNNHQMYILLDHHRINCSTIPELWYEGSYSEADWINDLKLIAQRYQNQAYFMGIDLKNEPHGRATWGTGNSSTDWNTAAEKAGREILNTNNNLLIFVEGVQDNPTCSGNIGHWYGGNLEPQKCVPLSESAIPKSKLIFSPHVYGPDVYQQAYFSDGNFPHNLPAIWDAHFGYLARQGYTIVPGEWGGKYGNGGDPKDKVWQDSLASYFKSNGITSSFYWDWNPNSGDTGGILQDDWKTPWTNKVQLLNSYFGN